MKRTQFHDDSATALPLDNSIGTLPHQEGTARGSELVDPSATVLPMGQLRNSRKGTGSAYEGRTAPNLDDHCETATEVNLTPPRATNEIRSTCRPSMKPAAWE